MGRGEGRRAALVGCFEDTMDMCRGPELAGRVRASREGTRLIGAGDPVGAPAAPAGGPCEVTVSADRTLHAAERLVRGRPGARCAVLNFASPVNPGGGVASGATAQECVLSS